MRKGILVAILLVAIAVFGGARAFSSARVERSTPGVTDFRARGTSESPTGIRRTLGLWLLAMTGTAVVLRARRA